MAVAIHYLKKTDASLVLLGSSSINIVKYGFNALAGSFVGQIMNEDTQKNTIMVEFTFQLMSFIGFLSAVALTVMLKNRGMSISDLSHQAKAKQ